MYRPNAGAVKIEARRADARRGGPARLRLRQRHRFRRRQRQDLLRGYTLEAEKVTYIKSTGKLIATGNVKMTDPSGMAVYANDIDITEDFRDGFVDSLRVDTPDKTYFAAESAERTRRRDDDLRQWRLHRLRALRGASGEAAALAGQGEARSSSTTRRRWSISTMRGSSSSGCRSPRCPISRSPTRR